MTKRKSIFQKASLFFGGVSLLLALASAVYLYLRVDELGRENPVAGSLLASIFFFVCVGGILLFIGLSNIPSFRFGDHDRE